MRKNLLFVSAALVALLSSCVKENISAPECNLDSKGGVTFAASYELPAKTAYDSETGKVTWELGDAVKFDYEIAAEDCEPIISEPLVEDDINAEGGASFTVDEVLSVFKMTQKEYKESLEEGAKNSRHLYVSYPADIETEYGTGAYYVTVPKVQDGKFENASIALAKWNAYAPTDPLHFMNFCALVKFTVDESMTAVRQIRFTAANRSIAGKASVTFTAEVPYTPFVKEVKADEAASTTITVNVDGPGTYYAAVLPGELKDICYAYYDAEGNPVGEIVSNTGFTAERSRVYNLKANIQEGNFPGEGGFFVKPVAEGTGDGSSWDNAADYAALHAKLDNSTNLISDPENPENNVNNAVTLTVYMAAGTHEVTKQLNVTPAHNVKIYGGYPADAKGMSLAGRDPSANVTVLDAKQAVKIWNLTAGVWEVSGLEFHNAKANEGAALTLKNNIFLTCSDCVFKNNVATKTGAGAVLFYGLGADTDILFENCSFVENKATKADGDANTGLGGAVGSANAFKEAVVKFNKCLFENNEAARNGGAMWFRTVSARIIDCNFINNKAGVGADEAITNGFGTQIFVDGSNLLQVYFDGCYFTQNTIDLNSMIHTNNSNAESCLALNNSVVAGAWGAGGKVSVYNGGKGKLLVSSSTLFGQMGGIVKSTSTGSVSVINSIVPHTATAGMSNSFLNNGTGTFTVKKSLYSLVKADQTFVEEGNLSEIYVNSASEDRNFPVSDDYVWYKGASNSQRENNRTTTALVEDVRGTVHYYAWDGAYPEGAEFTNATLEQVTQMVKDADAGFATWLGDRLGKDIRGNARDAQSMWPGSYQK